jgi:hypothetical protein
MMRSCLDGCMATSRMLLSTSAASTSNATLMMYIVARVCRLLELSGAKDPKALEGLVKSLNLRLPSVNRDLLTYKVGPSTERAQPGHGVPPPYLLPHVTAPSLEPVRKAPRSGVLAHGNTAFSAENESVCCCCRGLLSNLLLPVTKASLSPLQGVLSKLGAAKELMKEVLAREAKKQEERAAAKEKDVYVSFKP